MPSNPEVLPLLFARTSQQHTAWSTAALYILGKALHTSLRRNAAGGGASRSTQCRGVLKLVWGTHVGSPLDPTEGWHPRRTSVLCSVRRPQWQVSSSPAVPVRHQVRTCEASTPAGATWAAGLRRCAYTVGWSES